MKNYKSLIMFLIFATVCVNSFSQQQRLKDNNTIGWFMYTGAFKIKPKLTIHTEYQWRRADVVKNRQQGLFRTAINYAVRKDLSLNAGYAFARSNCSILSPISTSVRCRQRTPNN